MLVMCTAKDTKDAHMGAHGLSRCVAGIDPGMKGGICLLERDTGTITRCEPMPDRSGLVDHLRSYPAGTSVYLEHAQAMPRNGVVSMFNYGTHFGTLMGILEALWFPVELVRPRVWQAELTQGMPGDDPKTRAAAAAISLLGDKAVRAAFMPGRTRRLHDGMIDAYLIAEWGRRQHVRAAG